MRRFDIVIMDYINALNGVANLKDHTIYMSKSPLSSITSYHYLHVRNKELVPLLEASLNGMIKDGTLQMIYDTSIKMHLPHEFW